MGARDDRRFDFTLAIVKRGVHLAAPRVDPRGDPIACRILQRDSRERIQRRHAHQRLPCRKCQPLHRRNADAQAGERTRSRRDGERVDISQLHIDVLEEHDQVKRQSSGGR